MHRMITVVCMGFVLFFAILGAAQAAELDPQSLIGEWSGTWSWRQSSGRIELTIKSVQDGKVVGSVFISSSARYANRNLPIAGTVTPEGVLLLNNEYLKLTLTTNSPNKMNGTGFADFYETEIALRKSK